MRAAIYIRVSTEDQAQHGFSLAEQKEACKERAKELGITEIVEFGDEGITGTTLQRPGLEELREAIRNDLVDILIIRSPDRLSRKLVHQLLLTEEFEKAGVKLEFLDFEWQDTPEGRMFFNIKGAVSEYERELIRERTTRGKIQKARQGGIPMNFALYGYKYDSTKGEVIINDQEAEIVRLIYNQILANKSPAAITNELNESGVPTKKNVGFWHRQVIRQILLNSAYKGEWVYGKNRDNPIIIPVPAIVDENTWNQVNQRMDEARRLWNKQGRKQYLLRGLITCADCGTTMGGVNAKYWGRYIRCYTCRKSKSTSRVQGCNPEKKINADSLENIVWERVKKLLSDPQELTAEIQNNLPKQTELEKQLANINKKIAEIQKGRENLIELISSGLAELDEKTKTKLGELKKRKETLEKRAGEIQSNLYSFQYSQQNLLDLQKMASEALESLDDLDFETKQALIRSVVSQVIVSGRPYQGYHTIDNIPGVDIVISFKVTEEVEKMSNIHLKGNF